jgi:hypothetical protein
MDDDKAETICKRALVELVFMLAHQRQPKTRARRDWTLLRSLVREGLATGPRADQLQDGPWHIGQRPLQRPGRNGLRFVPLVTRGRTEIMMPTPEEAENLVAFLNWCGMPEFGER